MKLDSASQWYLEIEDHRSGPFTPSQILGLYRDGEVLAHHKLSPDSPYGPWLTVSEVIHGAPPLTTSLPTEPVPLQLKSPNDDSKRYSYTEDDSNPTLSLFNALQAVKEKQHTSHTKKAHIRAQAPPPEVETPTPTPLLAPAHSLNSQIQEDSPSKALVIILLLIGILALIFGVIPKYFKKASETLESHSPAFSNPIHARGESRAPPPPQAPLSTRAAPAPRKAPSPLSGKNTAPEKEQEDRERREREEQDRRDREREQKERDEVERQMLYGNSPSQQQQEIAAPQQPPPPADQPNANPADAPHGNPPNENSAKLPPGPLQQ